MLVDYIENNIQCNGKLRDYYSLHLKVSNEEIGEVHKIGLRLKLVRNKPVYNTDIDTSIKLLENQVTVRLRAADKVLVKKSIPIDFSSDLTSSIVLLDYSYEISNEQPMIMNYYGDIIIDNDDSNYLMSSSLRADLFLKPLKNPRLFIDLDIESTDKKNIYFRVSHNTEADFFEFKIGELSWIKLDSNHFILPHLDTVQYVQARGKKDDYYSYSNTIKIGPGFTDL